MKRKVEFVEGCLYHIFNRGVDRRGIFIEESDYERFMEYLYYFNDDKPKEYKKIGGGRSLEERDKLVEILCFELLPNHFHLLLTQVKKDGIIKFMRKVMTGYAMYFNKKYEREGVLFESRYKSKIVETDSYFCHLTRYIHLNCLDLICPDWKEKGIKDWRKIVEFLENYKWSSFIFYTKKINPYNILSEEEIFKRLEIEIGEPYLKFVIDWKAEDGPRNDKESFCGE
ncbi:MAG: transposase [Candidatus Omnitrophica bacterium]|nr:transposase [Candidatus Omnitrophota bacterium]